MNSRLCFINYQTCVGCKGLIISIKSNPFSFQSVYIRMNPLLRFLVFFLLGIGSAFGQQAETDRLREDIAYNADILVNAQQSKHRIRAHDKMVATLDSMLNINGSYQVNLDSISGLSTLYGDDFRLITWQLRISDEEYKYGGLIQWPDRIVHLKDTRPFINGSAYTTYTPGGWYGCLYYNIIPFEKEKVKYYMLLGFNAENSHINTKVADILDLTGSEPRLGVAVFTGKDEPMTRILLTYADIAPARMNYDENLKGIVHDHIESLPGVGPGGEALPVADGSLEAWILKKGDWVYEEEVYDVKQKEPPMTDDRKNRKEEKDIMGNPKKE
jgi:hypothetical protein